MEKISKDKLAELEAKHGVIFHIQGKPLPGREEIPWEIVLKKANRVQYKRYRSMSHNPAQVADAQETLVRAICVYPEGQEAFDALLDEWPGIPEACGKKVLVLSGLEAQEDTK